MSLTSLNIATRGALDRAETVALNIAVRGLLRGEIEIPPEPTPEPPSQGGGGSRSKLKTRQAARRKIQHIRDVVADMRKGREQERLEALRAEAIDIAEEVDIEPDRLRAAKTLSEIRAALKSLTKEAGRAVAELELEEQRRQQEKADAAAKVKAEADAKIAKEQGTWRELHTIRAEREAELIENELVAIALLLT